MNGNPFIPLPEGKLTPDPPGSGNDPSKKRMGETDFRRIMRMVMALEEMSSRAAQAQDIDVRSQAWTNVGAQRQKIAHEISTSMGENWHNADYIGERG